MDLPADGGCLCGALRYRVTAAAHRVFCRGCGTEIYFSLIADSTGRSLNLGTLDDPEAVRSAKHIWTNSQLSWFDVRDDLPRHGEYED